jgi:hypothetical protein
VLGMGEQVSTVSTTSTSPIWWPDLSDATNIRLFVAYLSILVLLTRMFARLKMVIAQGLTLPNLTPLSPFFPPTVAAVGRFPLTPTRGYLRVGVGR